MKLEIKQLGHKKFEVKTTNKNMRAMLALQLTMAKADDIEDLEPQEQVARSYDMLNEVLEFIQSVLHLSESDSKKLDELEFNETVEMANYIMARMMGVSDEDISKASKVEQKS